MHLAGIRAHNPPEDGVLQHFQQVLSLNIGDTKLDLGRSFDSISLKLARTFKLNEIFKSTNFQK